MSARTRVAGRHRLGAAGLVHCTQFAAVAAALTGRRRAWFTVLLTPARHSLAGLRRRSVAPAQLRWAPAIAT